MWQAYVHTAGLPAVADDWQRRLPIWILLTVAVAAGTLLARLLRGGGGRPEGGMPARVALGVGLGALLAMPAAWALSSVLVWPTWWATAWNWRGRRASSPGT